MVVTAKPSATRLFAYTSVPMMLNTFYFVLIIIRLKGDDYKILKVAPDP